MKLLLSALVFVFLNASNCSSNQNFKEIKFGEGGGFTGAVTEYRLKENGDIYKYNSVDQESALVKSITAEELKAVKDKLSKIPKEALNVNHPFNVYRFIKVDSLEAVWGDPSYTAPKELEDLYNYLNSAVKKK